MDFVNLDGYIVITVITILLSYVIYIYNQLCKLEVEIKESFTKLDRNFQRKHLVIERVLRRIRKYTDVILTEEIMLDIFKKYDTMTISKKLEVNKKLNKDLLSLNMNLDEYKEIKKDKGFCTEIKQLNQINKEIKVSADEYNVLVNDYNSKRKNLLIKIVFKIFMFSNYDIYDINI